jgi:hypothetical protein
MNASCDAYECVEPQHVLPQVRGMEYKQTDQVNLKTKLLKRTIIYQKRRAIRQGHNTLAPSFATKMAVPQNKTGTSRKSCVTEVTAWFVEYSASLYHLSNTTDNNMEDDTVSLQCFFPNKSYQILNWQCYWSSEEPFINITPESWAIPWIPVQPTHSEMKKKKYVIENPRNWIRIFYYTPTRVISKAGLTEAQLLRASGIFYNKADISKFPLLFKFPVLSWPINTEIIYQPTGRSIEKISRGNIFLLGYSAV